MALTYGLAEIRLVKINKSKLDEIHCGRTAGMIFSGTGAGNCEAGAIGDVGGKSLL